MEPARKGDVSVEGVEGVSENDTSIDSSVLNYSQDTNNASESDSVYYASGSEQESEMDVSRESDNQQENDEDPEVVFLFEVPARRLVPQADLVPVDELLETDPDSDVEEPREPVEMIDLIEIEVDSSVEILEECKSISCRMNFQLFFLGAGQSAAICRAANLPNIDCCIIEIKSAA